jgi:hypothetical protein
LNIWLLLGVVGAIKVPVVAPAVVAVRAGF